MVRNSYLDQPVTGLSFPTLLKILPMLSPPLKGAISAVLENRLIEVRKVSFCAGSGIHDASLLYCSAR